MCTAHQRLLDAVAAGGFCLLRDHPANHTCSQWIDLIDRAGADVADADGLRGILSGGDREAFDRLTELCTRMDGSTRAIDQVSTIRRLQEAGFFPRRGPVLPAIDAVAFDSAEQLQMRLARHLADPEWGGEVRSAQRRFVEQHFSYQGGMKRVLAFVAGRLAGAGRGAAAGGVNGSSDDRSVSDKCQAGAVRGDQVFERVDVRVLPHRDEVAPGVGVVQGAGVRLDRCPRVSAAVTHQGCPLAEPGDVPAVQQQTRPRRGSRARAGGF